MSCQVAQYIISAVASRTKIRKEVSSVEKNTESSKKWTLYGTRQIIFIQLTQTKHTRWLPLLALFQCITDISAFSRVTKMQKHSVSIVVDYSIWRWREWDDITCLDRTLSPCHLTRPHHARWPLPVAPLSWAGAAWISLTTAYIPHCVF